MKTPNKNKKIFTHQGLLLISLFLVLGVIFIFIQKSGKIETYFEKKYPQKPWVKIPPVRKYKVGFVTDAHARFSKTVKNIKDESRLPMLSFISEMNNNFHPEIVFDGGDFIDGTNRFGAKSMNDFAVFEKIFRKLEMPAYHLLGNHDLRGMTRQQWIQLNGYKNSYYYVDIDKLRIIALDGGLMPSSTDYAGFGAYEKQYEWLEDLLKNSSDFKKIIFIHQPTLPKLSPILNVERMNRLNELFSRFKVKAVFSGHTEILYYERMNGVNYYSIPGFYRSKYKKNNLNWFGSFSEIIIGRTISVKLFYKETEDGEYKTMMIPSEEYYSAKEKERKAINAPKFEESTDE